MPAACIAASLNRHRTGQVLTEKLQTVNLANGLRLLACLDRKLTSRLAHEQTCEPVQSRDAAEPRNLSVADKHGRQSRIAVPHALSLCTSDPTFGLGDPRVAALALQLAGQPRLALAQPPLALHAAHHHVRRGHPLHRLQHSQADHTCKPATGVRTAGQDKQRGAVNLSTSQHCRLHSAQTE